MSPFRISTLLCVLGCGLGLATPALAQLPQTRLYAVFPPGGQQGTTVEVAVTAGTDLDDTFRMHFSDPRITAVPKTQMVNGKAQPISGQFLVTIPADIPVGLYDLRILGKYGQSNPRCFTVSDLKENVEKEPNNTVETATPLEVNQIVNGRSDTTADLDYFKVNCTAGQRLLIICRAQRIDSRMEAALELYNSSGRRLARSYNEYRHDPVLDYVIPADGAYYVKINDFVYGGNAEYFYRLAIHTGPHVDFILPASGLPGSTAEYTLYGRNLPGGAPTPFKLEGQPLQQLKVSISLPTNPAQFQPGELLTPPEASVDGIGYTLATPAGDSNPKTIYIAAAPPATEQEPNNTPDKAQKLTLPVELSGQFQALQDNDIYTFEAQAGDVYWIELFGQRNGSMADPYFVLDRIVKNDKGEETATRLSSLDDNPANIGGTLFNTVTDDPAFRFVAPAAGTYRLTLHDRYWESRGAPNLTYRLAIRKESPDFRLVAITHQPTNVPAQAQAPWDLALRRGENIALNIMAFRQDGFNGAIELTVEGLPAGVTSPGGVIVPGQTETTLLLSSTDKVAEWFGTIRIVGKAKVENPVTAKAVTAAEAALKAARDALPALNKAVTDTVAAAKAAADKATAAKTALDADPKNAGLAKARTDADAASTKAAELAKSATVAKAAGDKRIADATAAEAAARDAHQKAIQLVTREARGTTIIWPGNPQRKVAADIRTTRTITLSVLTEVSPVQTACTVSSVEVCQNSQVLVPVNVFRRNGFESDVNITFSGTPKNIQVENKPIAKGQSGHVYRIVLPANAPVGMHTLVMNAQAQVSYRRNVEAADAAAAAKVTAEKTLAAATEAVKKVTAAKAAADKVAVDTANASKAAVAGKANVDKAAADALKKAGDAKAAADKQVAETAAAAKAATDNKSQVDKTAVEALKKATDAKAVADKQVTDTAAAAKTAADAKAAADKALAEANVAAKTATEKAVAAKTAAEKAPEDKALAAAKAAADKTAADAQEALKKAQAAQVVTDKAATDTAAAAKAATAAQAVAIKALADVTQQQTTLKAAADKQVADTAAAAKAATAAQAVAVKALADTTQQQTTLKAAADKQVADTAAAAKTAADAKAATEKELAAANAKVKADTAAKTAADKLAADTAKAATPKNINTFFPAAIVVVTVKQGPGSLALAVPNSGSLKRGQKLEVKVTVNRANGFAGPVTLSLPLPPGVSGLSAAPVSIPADQKEGTLVIQAAGDATLGQLPNLAVRATMEFNGPAAIDQPIGVNVVQ